MSVMQTIWQRRSDTEESDQIQRCALNKDISPATRGREATARIHFVTEEDRALPARTIERALRARWNQNISRNKKRPPDWVVVFYGSGDPIRHPFDCIDSGKDAENSASLRYRTDASRPFSLPRRDKKSAPMKGADFLVAATDLVEFAKTHLPILLGTQVIIPRTRIPREVHRIH